MAATARLWLCRPPRLRQAPSVMASSRSRYSTSNAATRPFRMAVVGSGPAGFYTAYRVMTKVRSAKVDMYEALPVPFGLVRFGVAPDHPEVKVRPPPTPPPRPPF